LKTKRSGRKLGSNGCKTRSQNTSGKSEGHPHQWKPKNKNLETKTLYLVLFWINWKDPNMQNHLLLVNSFQLRRGIMTKWTELSRISGDIRLGLGIMKTTRIIMKSSLKEQWTTTSRTWTRRLHLTNTFCWPWSRFCIKRSTTHPSSTNTTCSTFNQAPLITTKEPQKRLCKPRNSKIPASKCTLNTSKTHYLTKNGLRRLTLSNTSQTTGRTEEA
jgi:hypothetical protein